MQVFVEDWSARYGSPYLVGPDDGSHPARAELVEDGPELRSHGGDGHVASSLAFVDGVRRLEASLYLSDGEALAHGVAGSHACGAVLADGLERMTFGDARVARLAIFGAGMTATLRADLWPDVRARLGLEGLARRSTPIIGAGRARDVTVVATYHPGAHIKGLTRDDFAAQIAAELSAAG